MTRKPRANLSRILQDLGTTVIESVVPMPNPEAVVTTIGIYDSADDQPEQPDEQLAPAGGLLLGVGVNGNTKIRRLLRRLGRTNAAGLLVKGPFKADDAIRLAVADSGVALFSVTRAASWSQVMELLRTLVSEGDLGAFEDDDLAGFPAGDLFALANAVGALLDAPVTIEDRSSHVLAFSGRQDEADPARIETVLSRQVPERWRRVLDEQGVFRRLYQSQEPVWIDLTEAQALPRTAIVVRAGDEILGSMWAVVREPLTAQRRRAFVDSAKIVALHLLRQRAGADVQRRLRADLVSTLLDGGPGAADAARRLGIAGEAICVCGAEVIANGSTSADNTARELAQQRLADALTLHLAALHPRAASALIAGVAYAILPLAADTSGSQAVRMAEAFLARTGTRAPANIGIGRIATTLTDVVRSRSDVDGVLRVLHDRVSAKVTTTGTVARIEDVHTELLITRFADLDDDYLLDGPIARLTEYDAEHRTDLVDTLSAYLDAFGDVIAAAEVVHIHPNTFRYRLRRLSEIGEFDLTDPEMRLGAQLQLRIHRQLHRRHPSATTPAQVRTDHTPASGPSRAARLTGAPTPAPTQISATG